MADVTKNIVVKWVSDTSGMEKGGKLLQNLVYEETKLQAKVEAATRSIKDQGDAFETTGKKAASGAQAAGGSMSNLNSLMKSGASLVAGYFAVDQLLSFGKQIINITAEFQKMSAVLKNTLGSQSAADSAMKMIADFAAKTPFSVKELTESFIKLANRGIKPTGDQMRLLGDLAASQGKSFEQLTEAMLDAMTGEFERLKEFGITAKAQGDNVAFSFKGVTTEVERTDSAIKAYIQNLGELEGVSGSMAAISDTLGGKISNLGDNWDAFMLALGGQSSGILKAAVEDMNGFLTAITKSFTVMEMLSDETRTLSEKMEILFSPGGITNAINNEWTIGFGTFGKKVEQTAETVGLLTAKTKELKQAQEDRDNATTREGVAAANIRIEKLKEEIAELHKLGQVIKTVPKQGITLIDDGQLKKVEVAKDGIKDLAKEIKEIPSEWIDPASLDNNTGEYFSQMIQEWIDLHGYKVEIARDAAYAIMGFANMIYDNEIMRNQERLEQLEESYAVEMAVVGDNARAKGEIEREFAARRKEIEAEIAEDRRRQAIMQKALAVVNISVDTAQAVAGAIAASPLTFGMPWAAVVAAIGAAQIATVVAQRIPKYKDGVLQLQGPGTETSDSIPAYLSKGESVMTARETRENLPVLRAIREGTLPEWVTEMAEHGFDMARLGFGIPPELMAVQTGLNLEPILNEMRELKEGFLNRPEQHIAITERGIVRYAQDQQGNRTYLLNRHT